MTEQTRAATRSREQRARAVQERATRGHRRARRALGILLMVLVAAIAVTVVRSMATSDDRRPAAPAGAVVYPANLAPNGSIPVGRSDAPVTVALYFDYLCPACGAFDGANSAELARLLEAGTIQVELRPMAFLDDLSEGTAYSTRAARALATVADAAPERLWSFHTALYDAQPAEGSPGLTDAEIADIATAAGVPPGVSARFGEATFEPWVAQMTVDAFDAGVEGTPTILVNGQLFEGDRYTAGPLTETIEQAAGGH